MNPSNVIQLMTEEQVKDTFGLSDRQFSLLWEKNPPHLNIEGRTLFEVGVLFAWIRENYAIGGRE